MSKSSLTRRKIIAAAVQHIAGEDMYHRLELERIAEKAGVSEATIHYHFGRKDDFAKALWQSIEEERAPYSLPKFYKDHQDLLKDRDGQRKFIHQMLLNYYAFFKQGHKQSYRRMLRFFLLENIGFEHGRREHVNKYFLEELDVFHQVCTTVTGIDDLYHSSMLFLFTMLPICFTYTHLHATRPLEKRVNIPFSEHEKIILMHAEHSLLFHLGLLKSVDDARMKEFRS